MLTISTFIALVLSLTSCSKSDENKITYTTEKKDSVTTFIGIDTIKNNRSSQVETYKKAKSEPTFEEQDIWTPDGRTQMLIICNEIGQCDTVIDLLP